MTDPEYHDQLCHGVPQSIHYESPGYLANLSGYWCPECDRAFSPEARVGNRYLMSEVLE